MKDESEPSKAGRQQNFDMMSMNTTRTDQKLLIPCASPL